MNDSTNICPCCNAGYQETDVNCLQCGYPLQGTEQEQLNFTSERAVKEIELSDLGGKVRNARNSLFVVAGANVVYGLISYFGAKSTEDATGLLITEMVLASLFVALGFWAKKKTKMALTTGLVFFVGLHLLNAAFEPASILSGIIMKIFVVVYLLRGIKAVSEADQLKKDLNIA